MVNRALLVAFRGLGVALALCLLVAVTGPSKLQVHPRSAPLPNQAGHPTFTQVPSPAAYVYMPGVAEDTVIWGAEKSATSGVPSGTVYTATLRLRHPYVVAHATWPTTQLNDMRISTHWLSWIDYNSASGEWQLVVQNRHGGQQLVIDSSAKEGGRALPAPNLPLSALDGDTLIWSVSVMPPRGSPWTGIRVRVLPHGSTRLLVRAAWPKCWVTWPAIGGKIAAWDREGPCAGGGSNVMVADWRTGRTHALTHDHHSSEPTTNGRLLAYKIGSRFGNGLAVLVNPQTGQRRVVDTTGGAAVPVMTDRILAWYTDDSSTIIAQDLRTNRQYVLARASDTKGYTIAYNLLGQGWQDKVVFIRSVVRDTGGPIRRWVVVARVP